MKKRAKSGRFRGLAVFVVMLAVGIFAGSAISQWRTRAAVGPATAAPPPGRVRVEVLNGGGRPGAAREATEQVRDVGFDVVFFGNEGTFERDSSMVLDRVGTLERARAVADALGIRNVRSEPDSNLFLDVSVLLGSDWVPHVAEALSAEVRRPWWDPRGWLATRPESSPPRP